MARKGERGRASSNGARERILVAALEVFAERGFDGAHTREIAERAGANLSLIKNHFQDKERLWKAALGHAFAMLQRDLAGQPGKRVAARDWLDHNVRQFVRFIARHPEFMRIMNDESKRNSRRMQWLADHYVRPVAELLDAQLQWALDQGLVPPINPVSLRYIALGAAGLIFSQAPECTYLTGVNPIDPEFVEQHANAVLQFLTGSGKRTGAKVYLKK